MRKLMILAAAVFVVLVAFGAGRAVEAQSINIEHEFTITLSGTTPVNGLSGISIQAMAPDGVSVDCVFIRESDIEDCLRPSVATYVFDDISESIQGAVNVSPLAKFKFTGSPGLYDVDFRVLEADDDLGSPIIYSPLSTRIAIP